MRDEERDRWRERCRLSNLQRTGGEWWRHTDWICGSLGDGRYVYWQMCGRRTDDMFSGLSPAGHLLSLGPLPPSCWYVIRMTALTGAAWLLMGGGHTHTSAWVACHFQFEGGSDRNLRTGWKREGCWCRPQPSLSDEICKALSHT